MTSPAGQAKGVMQAAKEVEPAGALWPAGQGVQLRAAPPAEKVPTGQLRHAPPLPSLLYVPGEQLKEAVQAVAPGCEVLPGVQAVHATAPAAAYELAGQGWQAVAPGCEVLPGVHAVHATAPAAA